MAFNEPPMRPPEVLLLPEDWLVVIDVSDGQQNTTVVLGPNTPSEVVGLAPGTYDFAEVWPSAVASEARCSKNLGHGL
jgi:hypothetical protein